MLVFRTLGIGEANCFQSTLSSFRLKLKASCIVSEVLWTRGRGTFFIVGGTTTCQKSMEDLFIKRFTLTMDSIIIVLL